jgi:hypothetical protein
MNKPELLNYLEKLDSALNKPAMLYVYGSAVGIILDQPERTSLDIDVAAPYSDVAYGDLVQAAEKAGIPVNPAEEYSLNHIEWVQVLRLCLPKPSPESEMILWQGEKLTLKSGSVADLIASKLIRYDEIDQGDIQFLMKQSNVDLSEIQEAVKRLPDTFARDALVKENLNNLGVDMRLWRGDGA